MNKYTTRAEKTLANALYRELRKDKKAVVNYLKGLDTQKGFLDSLSMFFDHYISPMVNELVNRVKPIISRGAKDSMEWYEDEIPSFEIDFSIPTKPESVYLTALRELHLSQRKGSITNTTVDRIRSAVVKWTKEGLTYGQIADKIEVLDPFVFSRNRAELIAINQVGKAYQFGEYLPMKALSDEWYDVQKKWSTVHDGKVTPTHTQNEGDGWVPLDHKFSGTGDLLPPASDHPRCRCALLYNIL